MIRKSTIIKSLTALVMSALSSTIVQAEVLVPLDQFLATTTRHYEANQYKTAYTVYVPQSELQGDTVILNPAAVGEPVKLPITKKDGISYVDIESEPAMLGVSYTKNNGQLILGPAPEASTAKAPPAGTAVASAHSIMMEPRRRISSFKRPTAFSILPARNELLHTSSAN